MSDPKTKVVLAAVGVDQLRSISAVSAMTPSGMSNRTWISLDGEPTGLFALVPVKGLTTDDVRFIPANVTMANVLKLDLANVYQRVLEGVGKVEPQARAMAEGQLQQMESQMGLKLQDDLLKPLGDVWSVCSLPTAGPGAMSLAISVSFRDREKFAATHEKLLGMARGMLAQSGNQNVVIEEKDIAGNHVYSVTGLAGPGMPIAPAWCLAKDRLVISLDGKTMETLLSPDTKAKSLADLADVKKVLSANGPAMLGYQDTAAMVASTYSTYQGLSPMLKGVLASQDLDVNLPALPPRTVIDPHLRPKVSVLRRAQGGLLAEKTYTFPMVGADPATAGIAVALLLPAIQSARGAARTTQSTNNLKQIVLAMHNHHDANKKFPAPAITDKAGKPLLSWRVAILPYLDEGELYKEFHLDEPWDSEHNKKLIARMPKVYLNPSRTKQDGTTTYLLPTGLAGMFKETDKGVSMRHVIDGLSKTIAVVEVVEDHAVPWTKPDDLKIDPEKPLEGLKGSKAGGSFLVAFADGSVRPLAETIDLETLRALFTSGGREAVAAPD